MDLVDLFLILFISAITATAVADFISKRDKR